MLNYIRQTILETTGQSNERDLKENFHWENKSMNKQFIDKQKLAEQFVKETGFSPGQLSIGVGCLDELID